MESNTHIQDIAVLSESFSRIREVTNGRSFLPGCDIDKTNKLLIKLIYMEAKRLESLIGVTEVRTVDP